MSYVYAIASNDGRVKIGFTKNPKSRLAALKTMVPLDLTEVMVVEGTREHEAFLHKTLRAHRVTGEWFNNTEEVQQTLMRVNAGDWLGFEPRKSNAISAELERCLSAAALVERLSEFMGQPGPLDKTIWKFRYRPTEPTVGETVFLLKELARQARMVQQHIQEIEAWAEEELNLFEAPSLTGFIDKVEELRNELSARMADSEPDQAATLAAELEGCLANNRHRKP